jgi:hypothetical protein
MIILVAIVVADVILLGLTVWSARPKPVRRARFLIARGSNDLPHAL